MGRLRIHILVSLLLFIAGLFTAAWSCAESGRTQEHMLANGLKVLIQEDHKAPLVMFMIWYRVGGMDEVSGKTGLSHLLEHMMFKGTSKYGNKVLSRTVQKNGGIDNAFTSKDYTAYFQIMPSDRIGLSLDFESDRMRGLLLDPQETLAERDVVMEERRLRYEDDPQSALYEQTMAASYNVHPYARPVIGWMADLGSIKPDDLRAHYDKYYSPDNAVIIVVGDVEPGKLLEDIKEAFGDIKPFKGKRKSFISAEPPQSGQRRVYLRKEAELPYILATYHVPNDPHDDTYALDVLSEILSGGKSGRLYRSLVYDKKLALSASAGNYSLSRDPNLFMLDVSSARGVKAGRIEDALFREIDRMREEPPTDFELQKALNRLEAEFIMDQDSIYYQAMVLGWFEMNGDWRRRDSYIENIRKVTAEDVMRVAGKYLSEDNRTVGVLIPEPKGEEGKK
jgi:zinc protease